MSLRVIMGPMFAGKTSEIQAIVRRYTCLGRAVLVLTSALDDRYQESVTAIVNHDRLSVPARAVKPKDLFSVLAWPEFCSAKLVVIDEAQFFSEDGMLERFVRIAVDGLQKDVVLVGLDSDAERKPFTGLLALCAQADHVEKRSALCVMCSDGTPAIFTRSLKERVGRVVVGGAEMYQPVCRKHFNASVASSLSLPSCSGASTCASGKSCCCRPFE
jgi:thymidine kinase